MRFVRYLRALIIVGVVVGISYATFSAVLTGAPVLADPLTTHGAYVVGPGNYTVLSGNITGEDYIEGNYTVMNPPGAGIGLEIFNASEYAQFEAGLSPGNQWSVAPSSAGRIVFAAPYTDMFYFVFESPYSSTSSLRVTVYITTSYETNVVIG